MLHADVYETQSICRLVLWCYPHCVSVLLHESSAVQLGEGREVREESDISAASQTAPNHHIKTKHMRPAGL